MIIKKDNLISIRDTIAKQIEQDTNDANALKGKIETFKTSLSSVANFEGEIFGKISKKLDTYNQALQQRIDLSTSLATKIKSSLNTLIEAMGGEDMIDTSEKDSLKKRLDECYASMNNLNKSLYAYEQKKSEDFGAKISSIKADINYYSELIGVIESDIAKIERIEQADVKALSNLGGLDEMISSYKQKTADIGSQKSNLPTYIPSTAL